MSSGKQQKFFSQFFPPPKSLVMPYVGLSISDSYVRMVEFKKTKHGLVLAGHDKRETPPGIVERGYIHKEDKLAEVLKDIKKANRFEFIKTTLPEDKVYLFKIDIPWVENIRDALELKIEENVPISVSEAVFDYSVISSNKNEDRISLVVGVCPSKTVQTYLNVFEKAGLSPLALGIESQAISQSIIERGDDRTFLIVSAGQFRAGIFVVSRGVVHFTTSFGIANDFSEGSASPNSEKPR
jgi:Tfp pilus assembly PilM family ATPase